MNDLVIVDKIEKKLQEPREPTIFPLTPTHRKELRQLRNSNVGNLRSRLSTIETLKREEYEKKYAKEIEKELGKYEGLCETLNTDWEERVKRINKILEERKKLEDKSNVNKLSLNSGYGDVADLSKLEVKREYSLDRKQKSSEIAQEEFNEKYKDKFNAVQKRIDTIVTHYEEAINFGDLEIVKKLYYMMKTADKFFEKVSNLKI